jgi:hypothetical protein
LEHLVKRKDGKVHIPRLDVHPRVRRVRDAVEADLHLLAPDPLCRCADRGDDLLHGQDGAEDVGACGEGNQARARRYERLEIAHVQSDRVVVVGVVWEAARAPELDLRVPAVGHALPWTSVR